MRATLYRWLLPIGLATASLVGSVTTASAQPAVRDHRGPRPPRDRDRVDAGPREAPPPIREERVRPRGRGWVWVQGFWDWKGGRWEWNGGRWEKTRQFRRWRPVTWELRNGIYVRVDGDWIDDRPNQAPPPIREERFENRRGFTWVPGHWDWENGQYVWVAGKYERERRGKRWRDVRWELRDGAWVRVDGSWDDDVGPGPGPGPGGAYPTQAPPALRDERPGTKGGFIWIRGRWDWRNGQYTWVDGHWERERARERWTDGQWVLRDNRWVWIDGKWDRGGYVWADGKTYPWPENPDTAPPPLQREVPQSAQGRAWFPGRWIWYEGKYKWAPGSLVDWRPGYRLVPGYWEVRQNGKWTYESEKWVADNSRPNPPPPSGNPPPPPPHTHNPPPPPQGGPSQPPPPPVAENPGTKGGFVWIRGHHEWRGNKYEWIPGHWERERARQRWIDGRWELQGRTYVWIPGTWQ